MLLTVMRMQRQRTIVHAFEQIGAIAVDSAGWAPTPRPMTFVQR